MDSSAWLRYFCRSMLELPSYTLREKIHESSSRGVYRGYRNADKAPIVVKLVKSEPPRPRDLAALWHEFSLLTEIDCDGVVKAYALEPCGHSLALVLEDPGGASLDRRIAGRPLPLRPALVIARSLAAIVAAVHDRGIIHKDIKPHNVLVGEDPTDVHLLDFGIATRLSQEPVETSRSRHIEGTLAYMSPEQTGRMNRVIDYRTDLYSFGVSLYEMLTGRLPFESSDPMELFHSHIARAPTPPHLREPNVPEAVSAIVMRLLAKAAEDRYQSASGLVVDLDECISQLDRDGTVAPFPLGRRDRSDKLRIPQKLYGRDAEMETLLGAFQAASAGRTQLLFVTGAPGVGKTALVRETQKAIARKDGRFIACKFDKLHRDAPFVGFTRAFRELVLELCGEPEKRLSQMRAQILVALKSNGRLLIDLIPELEQLIGPQPPVAPVGPTEAQNRLGLLLQSFVGVIATAERPLVLFLDDLQWADGASRWLLQKLSTDPEGNHLLLVAAYRDGEIDGAHPLYPAIGEIEKEGAVISRIRLEPLSEGSVRELVGDTLADSDPHALDELARVAFEKTHGNPFFLKQFLLELHETGVLVADRTQGRWVWDESRVRAAPITDNVVELLVSRIQTLDATTRRLLSLAACIGMSFDLITLAAIAELPAGRAARAIWPALRQGLVVPRDPEYRFLPTSERTGEASEHAATTVRVGYRFLHDRVRQAAYSLIEGEERQKVHLRIGRRLRAMLGDEAPAEHLFEVVPHLNAGAALIEEPTERLDLARLDARAGRLSKKAAAYAEAAGFFAAGRSALGSVGLSERTELAFELSREEAECSALSGRYEEADTLIGDLIAHFDAPLLRAEVYRLRVTIYAAAARYAEAVEAGRAGLRSLGAPLPEGKDTIEKTFAERSAAIEQILARRGIESLLDAPELRDPEQQAIARLLVDLLIPAYCVDIELWKLVLAEQVHFALERGHFSLSAQSYVSYGFLLAGVAGRYHEAMLFGRLALDLLDKFPSPAIACQVNHTYALFAPFGRPLREAEPYFRRAYELGIEHGDFVYGVPAGFFVALTRFRTGEPLGSLVDDITRSLTLARRSRNMAFAAQILIIKQAVACLMGRSRGATSFEDPGFDERAFVSELEAIELGAARNLYHLCKAQVAFIHGDNESALAHVKAAEESKGPASGQHWMIELPFWAALSLAASFYNKSPEERAQLLEEIEEHRASLDALAEASPENAGHMATLVSAELARLQGRPSEAIESYERAISLATQNGYLQHAALANELYGRFFLSRGQTRVARAYISEALEAYARWGAVLKVARVEEQYPLLLPPTLGPKDRAKRLSTSTHAMSAKLLDVTTALRAAQAISSEIVLGKVLARVMRIVLANAGAQRGFLILNDRGELKVEALFQVDPDLVSVGLETPLSERRDLCQAAVQIAIHAKEPLVVADAIKDARLADDAHVIESAPKSILSIPLIHQGRLRGILYLENNALASAFSEDRVELLQMLCAQAAIAVENALLYSSVQDMSAELQEINQRLEREVAARTEALRSANEDLKRSAEDLRRSNERLEHELEEREKAESARANLQEEVIRMQSTLLEELSTPLIPINERVMVLPLIGAMDAQRADKMLEAVLHGATGQRAEVVIIDITGVKQVDAQVANTLVRAAGALRLIGSEVVLTGMRPEVARMLVGLDLSLSSLVTRGTLESGIKYAMDRSRRRRV